MGNWACVCPLPGHGAWWEPCLPGSNQLLPWKPSLRDPLPSPLHCLSLLAMNCSSSATACSKQVPLPESQMHGAMSVDSCWMPLRCSILLPLTPRQLSRPQHQLDIAMQAAQLSYTHLENVSLTAVMQIWASCRSAVEYVHHSFVVWCDCNHLGLTQKHSSFFCHCADPRRMYELGDNSSRLLLLLHTSCYRGVIPRLNVFMAHQALVWEQVVLCQR